LHEHHLIIRVGAGLIQFVYGSHSRMAADLTLDKNLFLLPFLRAFSDTDPVKPLLEVTRILQRVGRTNPRGVVANQHLILGQSNDTLVLPMSMPVRDLSPNTVVGISGVFSPIHFDCGSLHCGKNGLS